MRLPSFVVSLVCLPSCLAFNQKASRHSPQLFLRSSTRLFSTKKNSMEPKTLLACQKDAYLKESVNNVLFCEKLSTAEDRYRVILDDSVLYPEGGGQPFDLGTVDGKPVLKVSKAANLPSDQPWATECSKLVEVELATAVEVGAMVKCVVDWDRRFEFMQQHTAQHLFSAVADLLFKADTVGWSMGVDSATVDLASDPLLTMDQVLQIEDETNARIRAGSSVHWKVFSKQDLENIDQHEELQNFRGSVKGAALGMEELRLVSIADLDVNPCGGTHLRSLAEINVFKVVGLEKDRGAVRVRFVSGNRALSYFRACVDREAQLSSKLSVPPSEHVSFVDKLAKDKKDVTKRYDVYAEELAGLVGKTLGTASKESEVPIIAVHRPGADLKFLIKAGTVAQETNPKAIILLTGDEGFPVIPNPAKPTKPDNKPISGPFILFGEVENVNKVKDQVLALLGGRGGGRPGKLQGQGTTLQNLAEARSVILNELQK